MSERFQKLHDRLAAGLQLLPDKPEETARNTLKALWHTAAGKPISAESAESEPLPALDATADRSLEALIDQRLSGIPLAHLTGRQRFMGMEMIAGPGALVPRKETELLARAVIDLARSICEKQSTLRAVDICTGCGNVALTLAQSLTQACVYAADLSPEAVELARRNAQHLGLEARTEFRCGDLLAPFDSPEFLGQVDLLSCNPPYISSAKVDHMAAEIAAHEPHLAFDGGPFGVAILMRLLKESPRFVRSGGWLVFELGLGQGPAMARHFKKSAEFDEVRTFEDSSGAVRVLAARRSTGNEPAGKALS